jgi:hypothetical protein
MSTFLTMIPDVICPTCGSECIGEKWLTYQTTPPRQYEERLFKCGLEIRAEEGSAPVHSLFAKCRNAPEEVERMQKRRAAFESLKAHLGTLDVDSEFKNSVWQHGGRNMDQEFRGE